MPREISPKELTKGRVLLLDGELYSVIDIAHRTPGNWRA